MPDVAASLRSIVAAGDWPALADYVAGRFGVDLDPESLERLCAGRLGPRLVPWPFLTDGDLVTQLKAAIAHRLDAGGSGQPALRVGCELHIGFVGVAETEEHLERLRGAPDPAAAVAAEARSKVFSTPLLPRPIDRVATRVAPPDDVQR